MRVEMGMLERARRFLFGNDVFISYSRSDAAGYALALDGELTRKRLTCFVDQWGTPPGEEIPEELKTALRSSSMLVLVGTPGAAGSPHVRSEIEEFLKTGGIILPITFQGSLQKASWFASIKGIALTDEKSDALDGGAPSEHVIARIVNAEGFTRRNKRLGQVAFIITILVAAIVLGGLTISLKLRSDVQEQQKIGRASSLLTQAISRRDKQLDLALLLTLESYRTLDELGPGNTTAARNTLFELLLNSPNLESFLWGNSDEGTSLAFSSDGKKLASGNFDGTVTMWSLADKKLLPAPTGSLSTINSLAFSPDGNFLACGTGDGSISIWDERLHGWLNAIESDAIKTVDTGATSSITALAFSPDGKTLASPARSGIILSDLVTRQQIKPDLDGNHGFVWRVAFSPDGKTLASANNDGNVSLWDLSSKKESIPPLNIKARTVEHPSPVYSVAFSPDGRFLAVGTAMGELLLWDLINSEQVDLMTAPPLPRRVMGLAFSPDGSKLAAGVGEGGEDLLCYGMSSTTALSASV